MKTRKAYTKNDLDSRKPHQSVWKELQVLYHDLEDVKKIADPSRSLLGFNVSKDIAEFFDDLDVDNVRAATEYLLAHYKDARNNKVKSGQHLHFSSFCARKPWLQYFHYRLCELGNTNLMSCAYVELGKETKVTSDSVISVDDNMFSPQKRRKVASKVPPPKLDSSEAFVSRAHDAFAKKNEMQMNVEQRNRMETVQDNLFSIKEQIVEKKKKMAEMRDANCDDTDFDEKYDKLLREKQHLRRKAKRLEDEYETLKIAVGYNEAKDDDVSVDSDFLI